MSEPDAIRTILLGVDGSPESDRAATFAATLARHLGADVVAVHAVGLLDVWPEHPHGEKDHDPHGPVEVLLEGPWTAPLRRDDIPLRLVVRDGPPSIVLLDVADEVDADLIVLGSRGAGRGDLDSLGSTSAKIAQRSALPVVVVPAARSAAEVPPSFT